MGHPLIEQVDRLTHRLRRRGWLTGWSLFGTVVLSAALLLVGVDYLTRWSDDATRWIASGCWAAAIGWALYRFLLHPRGGATRPSFLQVAHHVERTFPAFGSRLTSAIEFLRQSEDDPTAGSTELRRAVISQTAADVEQVDFTQTIDRSPLNRAAACFGWLAAVVVLLAVIAPASVAIGVTRLAAPWAGAEWPRQNRLAFVDPPIQVARGQAFEAALIDEAGVPPSDVQVVYRFETPTGRRTERRGMQPSGGQWLAVLENIQQPFAFRATGGDDHTMDWIKVKVVDPPSLQSLTITAQPPAYTGMPASEAGSNVRVLQGTELRLQAKVDEPLASAVIELGDEEELEAEAASADDQDGSTIRHEWTASEAARTTYRLRLTGTNGISGVTERRRFEVEADPPPSVEWREPSKDLFVTVNAIVPIRVTVFDNLAIRDAQIMIKLADDAPATDTDPPAFETLPLYEGPDKPPTRETASLDDPPPPRELALEWDLTAGSKPPEAGAVMEVLIEARDYRPGVGRTRSPRRVTIISDEEFNQRVADSQSQLLRDLQRALEAERIARDKTRDIAANTEDEKSLLDRLATLGFDQRRVAELVADPQRGVRKQAEQLLDELARNQVDRPGLSSQLRRIADETQRLGKASLPEASRAVTDARRSAESQATERLAESLAEADRQQSDVVDTLEKLADEMAEWSDLEQFARELADLQRRQHKLQDATAADAAKTAAGLRSPAERTADRRQLTDAQAELARRFDKLMGAMQRRLDTNDPSAPDPALAPVEDTVAEADERATTGKLRDATRQIREGRLGRAGDAQQQAAEDLEHLLSTLRDRAASDPSALAKQLREAQQRLKELQEQLDRLSKNPAADPRQQAANDQRLSKKTERLSRRLNRLTADEASNSAQQGAEQMADAAEQSQAGDQQQGAQQSRQQAKDQLREAEQKLAERIRQLENEAAQRLLDQLADDVEAYIERQRLLLEQTVELADNTPANPAPDGPEAEQSQSLAGEQRGLEAKIANSAEKLAKRKVFSLVLNSAAGEMNSAAARLDQIDPGSRTQRHELSAIERLKRIADALESTPPDDEEEEQSPSEGQGGQQGQPQKPPPFDVAELKMLRLMQLDLNARTRQFESNSAGQLTGEEVREQAKSLAGEQRALADLVQELMNRNNEDPRLAPPQEVF